VEGASNRWGGGAACGILRVTCCASDHRWPVLLTSTLCRARYFVLGGLGLLGWAPESIPMGRRTCSRLLTARADTAFGGRRSYTAGDVLCW